MRDDDGRKENWRQAKPLAAESLGWRLVPTSRAGPKLTLLGKTGSLTDENFNTSAQQEIGAVYCVSVPSSRAALRHAMR